LHEVVDKSREEGLKVTYDVIAASGGVGFRSSIVDSFLNPRLDLPKWWRECTPAEFAEKLNGSSFRKQVSDVVYSGSFKFGFVHPLTDPYWMDCFRISECRNTYLEGKTIGDIVRGRKPGGVVVDVYEDSIETVFDVLCDDPDTKWDLVLDKRMHEGAVIEFLKHPAGMPCSDGVALPTGNGESAGMNAGSPVVYGFYPHYIAHYVREKRVLSLEEAVRKATSVPAQQLLGLTDRGVVTEGAYADLVTLDLADLAELGFEHLGQPPSGVEHVLVNGKVVYESGSHTGERPGTVIRRG
jgi:N-acyl-D-amino-acid deacylase